MTEFRAGRPGFETGNAPGSIQAGLDGEEIADILFELLAGVVHRQHPEAAAALRGKSGAGNFAPDLLARVFQAHGIWFQLLAIVEQHTAMRLRRQTERVRGETAVEGTFAKLIAEAASLGVDAQVLRGRLAATRIRPVITAHPTEAKRVTVLEKHRRIYRLLVELEQQRWTARERAGIIDKLRDEIALLWMTGELRLEKPTVDQEVAWGLHFFHETLFDGVLDLLKKLDRVARSILSGRTVHASAVLPIWFLDWRRPRRQPFRHQRGHPPRTHPERHGEPTLLRASHFRSDAEDVDRRAGSSSGPGIPGGSRECPRQGFWRGADCPAQSRRALSPISLLHRCAGSGRPSPASNKGAAGPTPVMATPTNSSPISGVWSMALAESGVPDLGEDLVRPVRRAVEIFRFRTVQARSARQYDAASPKRCRRCGK